MLLLLTIVRTLTSITFISDDLNQKCCSFDKIPDQKNQWIFEWKPEELSEDKRYFY